MIVTALRNIVRNNFIDDAKQTRAANRREPLIIRKHTCPDFQRIPRVINIFRLLYPPDHLPSVTSRQALDYLSLLASTRTTAIKQRRLN